MSLPKLLSMEDVADYFEVTIDTLARWEREGYGPASIKIGQKRVYPESAVEHFINAQLTGNKSATPAQIQAAMKPGLDAVRKANSDRMQELENFSRENLDEDGNDRSAITLGVVGGAPGIVRCDPFTGKPIGAQTAQTVFDERVEVAVADAVNGRVPVPKKSWEK